MKRIEVMARAALLITRDRAQAYGNAAESFGRIAGLWSAYLGAPVSPADVARMMVLLKVSRAKGRSNPDDAIDAAGYSALWGELGE